MGKGFDDWKKFGYKGWWKFGFTFWMGRRWGFSLFLGPLVIHADSHTLYFEEGYNPMPRKDRKIALMWLRRMELVDEVMGGETKKVWMHPNWIEDGYDKKATEWGYDTP